MDKGGTITWYLTANDADFQAVTRKVRADAKATAADVDRSLNKTSGFTSLSNSLKNLKKDLAGLSGDTNGASQSINKVGGDANILSTALAISASKSDGLGNSFRNLDISSRPIASTLGLTALQATGLSGSFDRASSSGRSLSSALGGIALKDFGNDLGNTGKNADRAEAEIAKLGLSLDDFHKSIGRSATTFRNFQIALRGFELTSLIVSATLAAGAIIELASAVASLAGLLAAVPAGIASLAGAIGTIKVATLGVAKSFKELTKQTTGSTAAQSLAKKQSDLVNAAQKRDSDLTKRLTGLKQDYGDIVQQLADEKLQALNEQILKGAEAFQKIAKSASDYLNISASLGDLTDKVAEAQAKVTQATLTYGAASQQAVEANRNLFEAQGKLAQSNADLDDQYSSIKDNIKDLATNLGSLQKANKNEIAATLANLKALKLDKQLRGESTDEISRMIDVVQQLQTIKNTKIDVNTDLSSAQADLDKLKQDFPDIAVAAQSAASDAEKSLTKSLQNVADSMAEVQQQRADLQEELKQNLAEAVTASAASVKDPFEGLSKNARAFVIALKDVYDAFQPVKHVIQDNFFAGLDSEIKQVANTTFPILQTGLGNIATAMNSVIKEAGRVVQEPFFTGAVASSLDTTAKSTDILKQAVEPLAKIITDLINIGNPYVIMLANWVVKQTELVAAFTGSEKGQKKINEAIGLGIKALKDIMKFIGAVGRLFYDVFKTSADSGFSLIDTLTKIVDAVDKWVKTKDGQEQLKALFEASSTVLQALAGHIGGVLKVILGLVQAYNDLDGPAKDIITNVIVWSATLSPLLTYLSSLVASLKLVYGVGREAFQAVGVGINILQSAPAAVEAFKLGMSGVQVANEGALGSFGKFGNAVGGIRDAFSNAVGKVGEFGKTLGTVAKDSASKAVTMAADGAKAAGGWIVNAAKMAAAWIAQFTLMIARGVATVAIMIAQAVVTAAAWVAAAVATAAAWIIANAAILGVIGLIIAAIIGAVVLIVANWDKIVSFFKGVWDGILQGVQLLINWVKENWPLLLAILTGPIGLAVLFITQNWETIKNVFATALDFIKGIWGGIVDFFAGIGNAIANIFGNVVNGVKNGFNAAVNFVKGIPGAILGALGNLGSLLWNAGGDMIRGLINGISNAQNFVVDKIKDICKGALNAVKSFFGIHSPSKLMSQMGAYVMEGFGSGIEDAGTAAIKATEKIATGVVDTFSGISTSIDAMQTDFSVTGSSVMEQQFAPAAVGNGPTDPALTTGSGGVVINQTNNVNSELDMDQVNRNLAWELNKI